MSASAEWAVVVAAGVGGLTGGLIGLAGGWLQRRSDARGRRQDLLRSVAVHLLSLGLAPLSDLGWYGSRPVRRFLWFHPEYLDDLRRTQAAFARELVAAKSELDLLIADQAVHDATDALLGRMQEFTRLAMARPVPRPEALQAASDNLSTARKHLRSELSRFIRPAVPASPRQGSR